LAQPVGLVTTVTCTWCSLLFIEQHFVYHSKNESCLALPTGGDTDVCPELWTR